jgi:hypothetical protein
MDRTARGEYRAKQKDEDGPASKRMAQTFQQVAVRQIDFKVS